MLTSDYPTSSRLCRCRPIQPLRTSSYPNQDPVSIQDPYLPLDLLPNSTCKSLIVPRRIFRKEIQMCHYLVSERMPFSMRVDDCRITSTAVNFRVNKTPVPLPWNWIKLLPNYSLRLVTLLLLGWQTCQAPPYPRAGPCTLLTRFMNTEGTVATVFISTLHRRTEASSIL